MPECSVDMRQCGDSAGARDAAFSGGNIPIVNTLELRSAALLRGRYTLHPRYREIELR